MPRIPDDIKWKLGWSLSSGKWMLFTDDFTMELAEGGELAGLEILKQLEFARAKVEEATTDAHSDFERGFEALMERTQW